MKLCCVVTKIGIYLYTPYQCTKFQLDQSMPLRARADFVNCVERRRRRKKNEEQKLNFGLSYLGKSWRDLLNFGIQPPLIGRHFHRKFGDLRVKGHRSMNA